MQLRKRTLVALSAFVGSALLVTACGSSQTATNEAAPTNKSAAPADPFGKYDPPIEISATKLIDSSIKFAPGESIDNNNWSKLYQDVLGIKVKYLWTVQGTSQQYEQKMNVSIASGELPDIIPVNASELKQLVDSGQVEDLTSIYNQYSAPLTKEIENQDGAQALKAATFNGKLMAIPNAQGATDGTPLLWVRTDWLKKLNLPEPKTMNDVFKIAEAFTTQDPNGTGKKDTFGLAVGKDLWGGFPGLEGFFNAFHAYPNIWIKDASGKLVYGSIQPEMKTALAKLQAMYKAGEIDREFAVKDGGKVAESMNRIGLFFGQQWTPIYPLQSVKNKEPNMQWQAYPIPSIDDQTANPQSAFPVTQFFAVKKGAKHPEAVVKMVNLFIEKSWGKTAEYDKYQTSTNGMEYFKYALVQAWKGSKNQIAQQKVTEDLKTKDTSNLNPEEKQYYDKVVAYLNGDQKNWEWERIFGPNGSQQVLNNYTSQKLVKSDQFFGAATATMADKKSTLDKLQIETFTKIIMGEAPVDEFDQFVANWKKLGGDQITKEVNDWAASQK